jgi:hypothetical protein
VFANGYGDCKDKALLLAIILRYGDVPAYMALLNTSKRGEMINAAASPDEFNHAIVAIESNGKLQFIDATMSMQKGALKDNYISAYGYALVVRDNETALRFIEPGSVNSMDVTETLKVSYDDSSTLSVRSIYKGGKGDDIRSYFSEASMKDVRDEYIDYYEPIFKNIQMSGDIFYNDDSAANCVLIKEEYSIPGIWRAEDKKRSFFVKAKAIAGELPGLPSSSEEYPLSLKYPLDINYTLRLEMPDKWSFPAENVHIKNDSYQFDCEIKIDGNIITGKYYLRTFKDHIPASELKQYRTDHKKMLDVTQYELYYTRNGAGNTIPDSTNWPAVWITFIGFFAMSILFRRLNKLEVDVEFNRESGWKIGGWMIVLGITLCLHVVLHVYNLFLQRYYSNSTWEILNETKGAAPIAYMELSFAVLKLSFCFAIVYWFFLRRDIFPRMFLFYVALLIGSNLFMYLWYTGANLPAPYDKLAGEYIKASFQSFIYAAIWTTYVNRSYRTKATFLKSYA